MKNNWKKANQTEFRVERIIKAKGGNLYVKWKITIIYLIAGLIKRISLYKMSLNP